MSKYYCVSCDYDAKVKSSFDKHLKTKKHMNASKSQHLVNQKSTFSQPKVNILPGQVVTPFQCHYCFKFFKFKQSMYKHIKYSCKKNKDEDLKELARLLNEKDSQMQTMQTTMQKQIDKLTNKLQIQNVVHGNVNQTQNNNNIYNLSLIHI